MTRKPKPERLALQAYFTLCDYRKMKLTMRQAIVLARSFLEMAFDMEPKEGEK